VTLTAKYNKFYRGDGPAGAAIEEYMVRKWPRNRLEAIVAVGGNGAAILDIGCGDGSLLYQYRNRFDHLIGLEYSSTRLEHARHNLKNYKFTGIECSAEMISALDENSVDRIITADVIEHIPDVYAAAQEMFRILKPNGLLIINTPNIAFIKKRVQLALGRFPSTSQQNEGLGSDILFDGGHLHYFTYRSLRLLLERAGFAMVYRMAFGRWGSVHHIWPPLTSGGAQWVARKPS